MQSTARSRYWAIPILKSPCILWKQTGKIMLEISNWLKDFTNYFRTVNKEHSWSHCSSGDSGMEVIGTGELHNLISAHLARNGISMSNATGSAGRRSSKLFKAWKYYFETYPFMCPSYSLILSYHDIAKLTKAGWNTWYNLNAEFGAFETFKFAPQRNCRTKYKNYVENQSMLLSVIGHFPPEKVNLLSWYSFLRHNPSFRSTYKYMHMHL